MSAFCRLPNSSQNRDRYSSRPLPARRYFLFTLSFTEGLARQNLGDGGPGDQPYITFPAKSGLCYTGCMSWKVYFFQTTRGDYPVKDFIKWQDQATYAKILHSVLLLKNHGPYLKPPYIKKLQDKLYELRISGKIAIRIFYTVHHNEYYLLHAFKKKSERTPSRELKIAVDRIRKII